MSMQAESLEVLEKADLPSGQARAIVRAIEIEIAGAKDTLATKHDILVLGQEISGLRGELNREISGLRGELHREISGLRGELHREISGLRGELHQELSELRGELRQETSGLRQEMAELRGELRAEIHTSASSLARQMYASLLGQMAVLLGIAYFFVTNIA